MVASNADSTPLELTTNTWPASYAAPGTPYGPPSAFDQETVPSVASSAYSIWPAVTKTLPAAITGYDGVDPSDGDVHLREYGGTSEASL